MHWVIEFLRIFSNDYREPDPRSLIPNNCKDFLVNMLCVYFLLGNTSYYTDTWPLSLSFRVFLAELLLDRYLTVSTNFTCEYCFNWRSDLTLLLLRLMLFKQTYFTGTAWYTFSFVILLIVLNFLLLYTWLSALFLICIF